MPLLDHLLGIVPRAARIGHEHGQHETRAEAADQQAHHAGHAEHETDGYRHDDGQQAGEHHLALCTAGRNLHAAGIVRRAFAREDALDLAELAAHLVHHALRSTSHGVHRQAAEQERHHGADEDADQHRRVHQRDLVILHEIEDRGLLDQLRGAVGQVEHRYAVMQQPDADLLDVGCQQRQCGQRRGSDGEALARGSGRIAQRVQRIGALAHLGAEAAHFGIAARIVSDRAVGVRGERDAQRREHTDGGDADAVEPQRHVHRSHHILHVEADGAQIGEDNRGTDRQDGDGRRDHARPDPGDDDRGRPGLGASGDLLRRFIGVRSVIFGSLSDDDTGDEPRDDRARQPEPVLDSQQVEDTERRAGNQQRTEIDTHAQRAEQLAHRGALTGSHEEDADDREHDPHGRDQHRRQHGLELHRHAVGRGERRRAQRRRGEHRTAIALIEVGAHAGHVAHVVAHVVGDGRGVARVVLRNPRLDLTHQVGTHVGRLGIDTAADACEERLRRGAHAEGQHRRGDDHEFLRPRHLHEAFEDNIPERDVQQPEPHDHEPHHGAAAEGDLQAAVERLACGVGRACRGVGRGLHAEITGKPRKETARQEGEGHPGVLHPGAVGQVGEEQRQDDEYDQHDLVLLAQVGHGALAHVLGDLAHARGTFVLALHAAVKCPGYGQSNDSSGRDDPENQRNVHFDRIKVFRVCRIGY